MPKKEFDLKKELNHHTTWIVHDIHSLKKRIQIKKELSEHLEDAVYHHMLEGLSEKESFHAACEELGDPKQLQKLFAVVHNSEIPKWVRRLTLLLLLVLMIAVVYVIPRTDWSYTLQSWISLLSRLICIILGMMLILNEFKYIRALCKRIILISKLKKLCKVKHFDFRCMAYAYTDLDNKLGEPSFFIQKNEETIAIQFAACLNKKDTYTFTDPSSYYTTSNFAPILLSFGYPMSGLVMKTPAEQRLYMSRVLRMENKHVKEETYRAKSSQIDSHNTKNILCIHPLPVKVQVVRTNRAEDIFDGDIFYGYTVYSGNGLCNYLKQN